MSCDKDSTDRDSNNDSRRLASDWLDVLGPKVEIEGRERVMSDCRRFMRSESSS